MSGLVTEGPKSAAHHWVHSRGPSISVPDVPLPAIEAPPDLDRDDDKTPLLADFAGYDDGRSDTSSSSGSSVGGFGVPGSPLAAPTAPTAGAAAEWLPLPGEVPAGVAGATTVDAATGQIITLAHDPATGIDYKTVRDPQSGLEYTMSSHPATDAVTIRHRNAAGIDYAMVRDPQAGTDTWYRRHGGTETVSVGDLVSGGRAITVTDLATGRVTHTAAVTTDPFTQARTSLTAGATGDTTRIFTDPRTGIEPPSAPPPTR